ncbi:MAG TPA: DNA alkylation repair protein [Candidatus Kapabacteria bacterium]|nr:DNA alkylation repair protein [Candidatus Kapabacteria bacterium]
MAARFKDKRLLELRSIFQEHADPDHAAFHKNYHKSSKKFYGLRAKGLTDAVKSVFPTRPKLEKDDVKALASELWASDWFEEQVAAIVLLERIVKELTPHDLLYLKKIVDTCEGWATLDYLTTRILGNMTIAYPQEIYPKVSTWTKSKHLWTRRAAILIHVWPARKKQLHAEYALPTFEKLLREKEFFIRKAIGWTLREMCKHYPEMVIEFLKEHRDEVSGLTMREGSRKLPARLKKQLIRK